MSIALVVLIAVQYVWLSSAVKIKREEFDRRVLSAMRATAVLLEEKNTLKLLAQNFPDDFSGLPGVVTTDSNVFRVIKRVAGKTKEENHETIKTVVNVDRRGDANQVVVRTQTKTGNTVNTETQKAYILPAIPEPPTEPVSPTPVPDPPDKIATVINRVAGECKAAGDEWSEVLDSAGLTEMLHRQFANYQLPNEVSFAVLRSGDSSILLSAQPHKVSDFAYKTELLGFDFTGQGLWLLVNVPSRSKYVLASLGGMLGLSLLFTAIIIGVFLLALRLIFKQRKLNEITNDFISNMTHEFKTPLATISMTADTLNLGAVTGNTEQVKEYAAMIKAETGKLSHHVDRILEAALQEKQINVDKPVTNLKQVIETQMQLHGNLFTQHEVTYQFQLPDEQLNVVADEETLGYVIANLLDNAVKYTTLKPHIIITVERTAKSVLLKVEDNGIGIRKEDREMIFEKFFRSHTGNRHDVKGFGLGLSFVRNAVESWGGKVGVESQPEKGSIFFIELREA